MKIQNVLWYNLSISRVFELLNTSKVGLGTKEALVRLKSFGFNRLPEKKRASAWKIFFRQFKSVLVYILLAAAVISIFLTEFVDFSVIVAAIFINIIVGFLQENKAEKELEKLQKILTFKAKVYRDGLLRQINSEELVPGDIVMLEAGDQIPADLRLFECNNLSALEAILTGESNPVIKCTKPVSTREDKKVLVAERDNMAFKGTLVAEGKAMGVVVATGQATEIGKIATMLETTEEEETPLQEKLRVFSRKLGLLILGLAAIILFVGLVRGMEFWEIFFIAMAAAVASVPEGLLVAVTVILAIGMQRILKKRALVRKLLAAETLGSTSVVCVDKTGTITQGKMKVKELVIYSKKLTFDHQKFELDYFKNLIKATLLSNNAVVEKEDDEQIKIIGSPTEKAILQASFNFEQDKLLAGYKRIFEVPFTSRAKIMYTLNQQGQGPLWCAKGAPEVVLDKCAYYEEKGETKALTLAVKNQWLEQFNSYSNRGFRLIATCYKPSKTDDKDLYKENDFIFLGFWVIEDPVRPEILETVKLASQAGIRTIMITGDHKNTAIEIAKEVGLKVNKQNVIDGQELMRLDLDQLKKRVKQVTVFARVSPEDKLKIVNALQEIGEVVAMTGDGVNDAPALKTADIGIAVGAGSDVTKSTADLILLNNNFRTIIKAVEQGRIIFNNIKKVIVYLLADSFSEMILVTGSLLLGLPLPITAAQILWINLITDGFPAAALTVEGGEPKIMNQRPIPRKTKILDKEMKVLIFVIGLSTDLLLFGIYCWLLNKGFDLIYIRTFIFAALGIDSLFYVFSCKSLVQPIWKINIFNNRYLIIAVFGGVALQLLPIYIPFFQKIFNLQALGAVEWLFIAALGILNIVLIEIVKRIFYRENIKKYARN